MELTADSLNSFSNVLPSGFFNKISDTLGISAEKTKSTMMTAIPAIFTELQKKVRGPDEIQNVANAIHDSGFDQPTSMTSDASNITTQVNKGQDLLSRLLGGQTDSLLGKISTAANVNTSTANKLLGAASTAVFTFIGSKMKGGTLAPSAFANILGQGTGFMPDVNQYTSKMNTMASSVSAPISGSTAGRKVWPWILLAIVIAIIWWSQGRNPAPVLSTPQSSAQSVQAPTDTTIVANNDASVINELSQYLTNPAATVPSTFTLRELNFPTNSATLSTNAASTATALAILLQQFPDARIRIIGHTDNVGMEDINQRLSMDRAEALRSALISQGIAADRIEAAGMGSTQPLGDNGTIDGRDQNRRVDIEVIRK